MGMSPSCHCICPGVGDIGSSGGGIETTTGCEACVIAPMRYYLDVTAPTPDGSAACCDSYRGRFLMHKRLLPANNCLWDTEELALCVRNASGALSCFAATGTVFHPVLPRFTLQITVEPVNVLRYTVTGKWYSFGEFRGVNYTSTVPNGNCMDGLLGIAYSASPINSTTISCGGTQPAWPCVQNTSYNSGNTSVDVTPAP